MDKLPREPMRPQNEPFADKEIWQPHWKCFCCHDTGIVNHYLAAMVIDKYDFSRDKLPRCHNPHCEAGRHYDGPHLAASVDYRLTPNICANLDSLERQNWQNYILQKLQNLKIDLSSIGISLRQHQRTATENVQVQQKHEEIRSR